MSGATEPPSQPPSGEGSAPKVIHEYLSNFASRSRPRKNIERAFKVSTFTPSVSTTLPAKTSAPSLPAPSHPLTQPLPSPAPPPIASTSAPIFVDDIASAGGTEKKKRGRKRKAESLATGTTQPEKKDAPDGEPSHLNTSNFYYDDKTVINTQEINKKEKEGKKKRAKGSKDSTNKKEGKKKSTGDGRRRGRSRGGSWIWVSDPANPKGSDHGGEEGDADEDMLLMRSPRNGEHDAGTDQERGEDGTHTEPTGERLIDEGSEEENGERSAVRVSTPPPIHTEARRMEWNGEGEGVVIQQDGAGLSNWQESDRSILLRLEGMMLILLKQQEEMRMEHRRALEAHMENSRQLGVLKDLFTSHLMQPTTPPRHNSATENNNT